MLEVRNVQAGYNESKILFNINLSIQSGSCSAILGRNGMGKTTIIKSILGIIPIISGEIFFLGKKINGRPSHEISNLGIGIVPEGRHIFSNLTVRENLETFYKSNNYNCNSWNLDKVLNLFPKLQSRLKNFGDQLSGGEQQMLAIGRALMTNPQLLILDEATEGLAPIIKKEIWECLRKLKSKEQSILIIDKNIFSVANLSDYNYIIEKGKNVWEGKSNHLLKSETIRKTFLSL